MKLKKWESPYKLYQNPKKALFKSFEDEAQSKEVVIIGEDKDRYITHINYTEWGEWEGEKVIKYIHEILHGIHKCYFIQWTYGQLELFDERIHQSS